MFTGFGDEALLFYEGLEADNSRSYWTDQAERYERAVRAPMLALIAALEPEFGPMKFFRPQRDLRFSADKSPYKTTAAAVTRGEAGAASYYVQFSADGLMYAAGYYRTERDQVERYRLAVADDRIGGELARVVRDLEADGYELTGETLKRAPRGFDPDHPRVDLLRRKSIAAVRHEGVQEWVGTPECLDRIVAGWRRMRPLAEWLEQHVGPPDPRSP
jgi:uncharacterized protein (TIGR02453 family)